MKTKSGVEGQWLPLPMHFSLLKIYIEGFSVGSQ